MLFELVKNKIRENTRLVLTTCERDCMGPRESALKIAKARVKQAMEDAQIKPSQVKGIGFDATCSLVALDEHDRPVTVSPNGNDAQNIIVWMDHR